MADPVYLNESDEIITNLVAKNVATGAPEPARGLTTLTAFYSASSSGSAIDAAVSATMRERSGVPGEYVATISGAAKAAHLTADSRVYARIVSGSVAVGPAKALVVRQVRDTAPTTLPGTGIITIIVPPPDPPPPPDVTDLVAASVTIGSTSVAVLVGATAQITAAIKNAAGGVLALSPTSWTSSNDLVATVNGSGLVTGVIAGAVTITAHYNAINSNAATVTASAVASQDLSTVNLPLVYLNTDVADTPCAKIRTIVCTNATQLAAALADIQPDDWIRCTAGVSFAGPFTVTRGGTAGHWVWIDTTGTKPAEHVRYVGATDKAIHNPPIITTADTNFAITFSTGAKYIRMMGIEVAPAGGATSIDSLVGLSSGQESSVADLSHDIILDRDYIHSRVGVATKRNVALQNVNGSLLDCDISEAYNFDYDAQAAWGWNGPGPYKIVNCRLEASGECFGFGGATPNLTNNIPSDVEAHHNLYTKLMASKPTNYLVKNLIECKVGRRMLFHSSVCENSWQDDQLGWAFVFWSVNQPDSLNPDGRFPLAECSHVTIRDMVVINCASIGQFVGGYTTPCVTANHIAVSNILAIGTNNPAVANGGLGWLVGNTNQLSIEHTTGFLAAGSTSYLQMANSSPITGFKFKNNLGGGGNYPINVAPSPYSSHVSDGGSVAGNVIAGADAQYYAGIYGLPSGNHYPTTNDGVGLVGGGAAATSVTAPGTDLALASSSAYKGLGTDGTDPGADVPRVLAAVVGVGGGF